jgi:hypothetical protein
VRPGDRVRAHSNLLVSVLSPSEADEMDEAYAQLAALLAGGDPDES